MGKRRIFRKERGGYKKEIVPPEVCEAKRGDQTPIPGLPDKVLCITDETIDEEATIFRDPKIESRIKTQDISREEEE